jgi:hypothetical protein
MAAAEAPPLGVYMGKEFKLFRQSLLGDYCHAFSSLPINERDCFSPPSDASIEVAWELFCRLNLRHEPPTKVLPSPEGGVGLCFCRNGKYADFECFNSGIILVAMSDRHGKIDVFEVDLHKEAEVDDVISRIGHFLGRQAGDALPLAASCRK